MRRYRAPEVAAFVLLVITVGCNSTPVTQQPAPAPVKPPAPVKVATTNVPITITSDGLEVIMVDSDTTMLSFKTTGDKKGFTVTFPKNMTKYPPACAPLSPTTPPQSLDVCPGPPVSCTINPYVANGAVYYNVKAGLSCPTLPAPPPSGPTSYSVVRCPRGGC
jgi:hypothetical protein